MPGNTKHFYHTGFNMLSCYNYYSVFIVTNLLKYLRTKWCGYIKLCARKRNPWDLFQVLLLSSAVPFDPTTYPHSSSEHLWTISPFLPIPDCGWCSLEQFRESLWRNVVVTVANQNPNTWKPWDGRSPYVRLLPQFESSVIGGKTSQFLGHWLEIRKTGFTSLLPI